MEASVALLGRAYCPVCGAPRRLGSVGDVAPCDYCGTRTHIVRRLRAIEPLAVGGFEPGLVAGRPDRSGGTESESVACPGCGSPLTTDSRQALVRCPHCAAWSKIERTLAPDTLGAPAEYMEPRHRFPFLRRRRETRDAARDAALGAVFRETDLHGRVQRLLEVTPWEALNPEREETFTRLLELAPSHSLLDRATCVLVRRHLLKGDVNGHGFAADPWRYFVLRCATRVAFRPDASGRLVKELRHVGAGGAALKLLLDIADYALQAGELDYAGDALDALDHTVTETEWARRGDVNEILLYRLPYVDERLAAWMVARMSFLWTAGPQVMARLVDDCAMECPALAPVLANRTTYLPCPSLEEYREHAAFIQTLFTALGRAVALESYVYVPGGDSPGAETVEYFLAFFEALRGSPESEVAATRLLRWWVDDLAEHHPETLPAAVAAWRERLPENPKWPPDPRDSPYEKKLESVAASLLHDVGRRSSEHDDVPESDDSDERNRTRAVVARLEAMERDLVSRTRKARWGTR